MTKLELEMRDVLQSLVDAFDEENPPSIVDAYNKAKDLIQRLNQIELDKLNQKSPEGEIDL